MAGNVLSGGTDVVASTIETPSSAVKTLGASVVMAAAIFSGQDARAAEIGASITEAKNVCMAESKANWSKLLVLAEKKKAAGETDKAATLQAKYDKEMVEADKTCETLVTAKANIAKSEANIAKSEANIAKISEVRELGKTLSQEVKSRLALVDSFSEGDVSNANDSIAFLNRGREYIAKAREVYTDTDSIARLAQLESNFNLLAARLDSNGSMKIAGTGIGR